MSYRHLLERQASILLFVTFPMGVASDIKDIAKCTSALTMHQPWASNLVYGVKQTEGFVSLLLFVSDLLHSNNALKKIHDTAAGDLGSQLIKVGFGSILLQRNLRILLSWSNTI